MFLTYREQICLADVGGFNFFTTLDISFWAKT